MLSLLLVLVVAAAAAAAFIVESRQPAPQAAPEAIAPTPAPTAPAPPAYEPPAPEAEPQQQTSEIAAQPAAQAAAQTQPPPAAEPAVQPAPEPAEEPNPAPAPTPAPALLRVAPNEIRQGETVAVLVDAEQAASAALRVEGALEPMIRIGARWFALQPFAPDTPLGARAIEVELYDDAGELLQTLAATVQVAPSNVPLEEIIIGGGSGAPADPEALQRDIDVRFTEHASVTGPPRWAGPWRRPVAGEDSGLFGAPRSYNGYLAPGWHHGHDIAADHGDPVVASAAGRVAWTGELALHGIGVILDHGAGVYSGYWHLSLIAVNVGDDLAAGDWLGNIGVTGLTTGPHLHWEVIVRGQDVDPLQWLGPRRPRLPGESGGGW